MSTLKIQTIFDLIKNKEPRGFELLYEQHFRMIYGIAYSVTADEQMSKDAVQNVLLKLYQLEPNKFPKAHELTWLYTVTKNEALQLLRKEKSSVSMDVMGELPVMDKGIEEFADLNTYYSLIEPLSSQQKQVVTLKVLGGLSHKEIAQMLDRPIGTIQWIYNTSIKQLRIALYALSVPVVAFGAAFLYKLTSYLDSIQMGRNPRLRMAASALRFDSWIVVFGAAFVCALVAWILFFLNTDKFPLQSKSRASKERGKPASFY